jgi:hypothetical protein
LLYHYGQAHLLEWPLDEWLAFLSLKPYQCDVVPGISQRTTYPDHALVIIQVIGYGAYDSFCLHSGIVKIRGLTNLIDYKKRHILDNNRGTINRASGYKYKIIQCAKLTLVVKLSSSVGLPAPKFKVVCFSVFDECFVQAEAIIAIDIDSLTGELFKSPFHYGIPVLFVLDIERIDMAGEA